MRRRLPAARKRSRLPCSSDGGGSDLITQSGLTGQFYRWRFIGLTPSPGTPGEGRGEGSLLDVPLRLSGIGVLHLAQQPHFPPMIGLVVQAVQDVISDASVAGGIDDDGQLLRRERLDGLGEPIELR